jgi:hypothetical protein
VGVETVSDIELCSLHALTFLGVPAWERVQDPVEKVKLVMFSAQEIIISSFYVYAAYRYLQSRSAQKSKTRRAMFLLLLIQVVIIAVDITIVAVDMAGNSKLKLFIHSSVYSVKLELEFVVLNQLVELSKMGMRGIPTLNLDVADARTMSREGETAKKMHGAVKQQLLPASRPTSDTIVDLEACDSNTSKDTLEFITAPQHMHFK